MDDDDEEFLAPPDDNVAPDFGGWELFVLLGLHKRDERYFQRAIADPQFDLNTRFEYVKRVRMSYYVRYRFFCPLIVQRSLDHSHTHIHTHVRALRNDMIE